MRITIETAFSAGFPQTWSNEVISSALNNKSKPSLDFVSSMWHDKRKKHL